MMLIRLSSRRWILSTILVICAMAVMARLGIWQLDRLEKRRGFNARVQEQMEQAALDLNLVGQDVHLPGMEYRKVNVVGEYLHDEQIALRNQYWGDQWGVHLVTPLRISGSDRMILVDRGWIPAENFQSGDWSRFDEPGVVAVSGILRSSQNKADFGSRSDPEPQPGDPPLKAWNFVNIERLSHQISGSLLPVYVQQAPIPSWTALPYRYQPSLDLSEGPHFGYAIQWFTFASILGIGYPFFILRQERKRPGKETPDFSTLAPSPIIQARKH